MRALPSLAAALLGVACALLVGCGEQRDNLIPAGDAASLEQALDSIAAATGSGDCAQAQAAVVQARGVLVNLPDGVDARLQARLREGIENLAQVVRRACTEAAAPSTPSTPAEPTPSTPAETTPSVPAEPTPSVPAEPTPSVPAEPTPSVPAETTPGAPEEPTPGDPGAGDGDQDEG